MNRLEPALNGQPLDRRVAEPHRPSEDGRLRVPGEVPPAGGRRHGVPHVRLGRPGCRLDLGLPEVASHGLQQTHPLVKVHSACVTRVVTYKGWISKGLSICLK